MQFWTFLKKETISSENLPKGHHLFGESPKGTPSLLRIPQRDTTSSENPPKGHHLFGESPKGTPSLLRIPQTDTISSEKPPKDHNLFGESPKRTPSLLRIPQKVAKTPPLLKPCWVGWVDLQMQVVCGSHRYTMGIMILFGFVQKAWMFYFKNSRGQNIKNLSSISLLRLQKIESYLKNPFGIYYFFSKEGSLKFVLTGS